MLDKGFNDVATVIDMQKHIDGRTRRKGLFTKTDHEILRGIDRFGASTKMMKDMQFKPAKARQSETGERAFLYLAAAPYVPMFEIAKHMDGSYVLREGYFKEPRKYSDLFMLSLHVKKAIKDHKDELSAALAETMDLCPREQRKMKMGM